MLDILKSVDQWALILIIVVLGSWFVWSAGNLVGDLKTTIAELKTLVASLTETQAGITIRLHTIEEEHTVFKQMFKSVAQEMDELRLKVNTVETTQNNCGKCP